MKERPILFSGPMVQAILEGRKTQTRRVIKPQPRGIWGSGVEQPGNPLGFRSDAFHVHCNIAGEPRFLYCPFGRPGDRLWVRETWAPMCRVADPDCHCEDESRHYFEYRADTGNSRPGFWPDPTEDEFQDAPAWKPSIHMPRRACRLELEVTRVRVERIREITLTDVFAEGCILSTNPKSTGDFKNLWDSINGARGFGWETNPWVWVIDFKPIKSVNQVFSDMKEPVRSHA